MRSLSPEQPPLFRRLHSDVNQWSSITEVPPSVTTISHNQVVQPPAPLHLDQLTFLNVAASQPSSVSLIDGSRDFILRQLNQTLASHAFSREEVALSLDEAHISQSLLSRMVPSQASFGFLIPMLLESQQTLQSIGQDMNGTPALVGSLEIYNRDGLAPEE